MTTVTVYDGAEGIGANKIEILDEVLEPTTQQLQKTRILLDFGSNMQRQDQYFDKPYAERDKDSASYRSRLGTMRRFGLLPDGLGTENYSLKLYANEQELASVAAPSIQAIFLSHAHQDHNGWIGFLNPKIPLFATPETLCFHRIANIKQDGNTANRYANNEHFRQMLPIEDGETKQVGSIKVTAVRVDHSMPGPCAFLIETSDARIVYTGDFRLHGTRENYARSENFIAKAVEFRPGLLISEGTNINEYSREAEESHRGDEQNSGTLKDFLAIEVGLSLGHKEGMILVNVSAKELDRLDTLYEVVRESAREDATYHLSVYNAELLEKLAGTGVYENDEEHIVRQFDTKALLAAKIAVDKRVRIYERYAGEFSKNKSISDELKKLFAGRVSLVDDYGKADSPWRQAAVILLYSGDIELLDKLDPPPRSKYINSISEAFTEELVISQGRLLAWVNFWKLSYHQMHVSGHIYGAQLKQAIVRINPTYLLPLHTLHREIFPDLMADAADCLMVKHGVSVPLTELLQKKQREGCCGQS